MLKYSYEVKTDKDKLEFSVRTEELLRLEHNEMGARFRNAEISESEWSNYLKNDFVPKSRMISGNVAKVRDDMGINTKEKIVLEDFTTYTETDAPGRITVNSSIRSTVLDGDRDEAFYLYSDKGVDFFSGDFEHWATFNATDNALYAGAYWGVSNSVAAFAQQTNSIALFSGNTVVFLIRERDGGTEYDSGVYSFTGGTDYYFKLIRDEAIGTYGTMYADRKS